MATNNKTTLNLKMTDTNNKSKTFNVGYVNPDTEDIVLKQFGQKIADLTQNTLNEIYRTNVEDITNASTDTSIVGFAFASSSDFLSDDSDTYATAIATLPGTTGNLVIRLYDSYPGIAGTRSIDIKINLQQIAQAGNFANLIDLFNYSAYSTTLHRSNFKASKINSNGILFDDCFINYQASNAKLVYVMEEEGARSENVAAWIEGIGENLINISGYDTVYKELFGTGSMKGIVMTNFS